MEVPLRERFASIGIEAGKPFPTVALSDADKSAMAEAGKSAEGAIKAKIETMGKLVNGWIVVNSGIGDRTVDDGDWTQRAAVAAAGILANDPAEAVYPITRKDGDGNPLDGSKSKYTLTFAKDQFPPVNAFWSVTMYDGKTQLLIKNLINRYLINSPILPELKKNTDGSLTLHPKGRTHRSSSEGELVAGARRADLSGDAALLANGRGAEWHRAATGHHGGQVGQCLTGIDRLWMMRCSVRSD